MKKNRKWWIVSGVLTGGLVIMAASVGPIMSAAVAAVDSTDAAPP